MTSLFDHLIDSVYSLSPLYLTSGPSADAAMGRRGVAVRAHIRPASVQRRAAPPGRRPRHPLGPRVWSPAAGPPSFAIAPDAARASCAAPPDLRARHRGAADLFHPDPWAVSRPSTISLLCILPEEPSSSHRFLHGPTRKASLRRPLAR